MLSVLSGLGMAWMTLMEADSGYVAHVLPPLVTLGVGFGLIIAPAMSTATSGVEPADAGVASATGNTSQQVGGSIGTALLNTLAAAADYLIGRQPTADVVIASQLASYHTAFWWTAAFFAIGALACGPLLPSGRPVHNPDAEPALVH
ncbi:hypothetical protein J2S43_002360 [Catenuloplanes nepalensis]|uniref:Uncharacterized protein n=1 Tax=Catenuloplanes nepalensis TaxID=587533 RepID=A0ABT9MRF2_9ACTN|nr:hypothetical protein [Catenuloplanes nepalensis]